jgi:hypothetical protein
MIPARIVGVGFFIDNPARIVGLFIDNPARIVFIDNPARIVFIDNACIYTPYSPALNVYPYF